MQWICQKKIAQKITEKHANYLFSLKENHEPILDIAKAFFACHELDKESREKYGIQKLDCETEIGHGRIEKREYYLCTALNGSLTGWIG